MIRVCSLTVHHAEGCVEFAVERNGVVSSYRATREEGPVIPLFDFDDAFYRDFDQDTQLFVLNVLRAGEDVQPPAEMSPDASPPRLRPS
jgi:hypothetical protein